MTTSLNCSVRETAALLGVSERHVYTMVKHGDLPRVPLGGRVLRIPRIAIEALVASAMPTVAGSPPAAPLAATVGIGGTAPGSSGKSASAGPSTSAQGDGAGQQPDAIEERAAYSAQKAG